MIASAQNDLAIVEPTTSATQTLTVKTVNYEVVHRVDGRIRVKIPGLSRDAKFAQRLTDAVTALPAAKQVRVNRSSASLLVSYRKDPSAARANGNGADAGDALLPGLVECIRVAAKADVARDMAALPQAERPAPILPALPAGTVNYVQQLGLPVLSLGLGAAMAAGLALPGALVGAAVLAATIPHARRAVNGLREEKRPTVEILDVTAVALLVAQSSFLAPAFMISVIEGAEVVRSWTTRRGRQAGVDLLLSQKRQALVEREGQQVRVGYEELAPGDIVLVYPGDEIPVDGKVLDGSASIDQHRVTGDPAPVVRQQGDEVYAATVVVEGHLHILATHTGPTTHAASLIALAEAAPKPDTRVSNYARRTGNPAVAPTLAIGGAIWAASGSMGRAAGIVSLDMGLGMRVSAPIAILTAQNYAARHGIVIRSGRALEMLAQADTFLFDKTATLTDRVGVVIDVQSLAPDASPHEILALAASVEQGLDHPVAEAVARYAQQQGIQTQPCTDWNYLPGQGVVAKVAGRVVHVGSTHLMEDIGIAVPAVEAANSGTQDETTTRVFVALDGELAGVIRCANPLRAESAEVIAQLRELKKSVAIFSGDSNSVVRAAAADLDVSLADVYAEVLPQQKADIVTNLQASGKKVAVVGDGINDAAAMAHADVAISLGSASALARETADVVLLTDDLRDLIHAIEIAQHALTIIRQNQAFVVGTNSAGIAYGVLAVLNPIAGVLLNNGVALVAALNSLRTLKAPAGAEKPKEKQDSPTQ